MNPGRRQLLASAGMIMAAVASAVAWKDTSSFGKAFEPSAYLVWQIGSGFDADREHTLEIRPVFDDGEPQEFRLGSICVAGRNAAWVKQDRKERLAK